jgi:amidase
VSFSVASPGGGPVAPECQAAAREAAALCAQLGHDVCEAAPGVDWVEAESAFLSLFAAACAAWVDGWAVRRRREPAEGELEPFTRALAARGRAVSAPELLAAVERLQQVGRTVGHFMRRYDVWLTPTLAQPPVPLGYFDPPAPPGDALDVLRRDARFTPFTWVANATGQPAASLPLHWSDDGLPIGVMAATRLGDDGTLLALAAQLERARPWAERWPPLGAAALA